MDTLCLLVLLIFSSNSRGERFLEISSIGEVISDGYYSFEEGVGDAPIAADPNNTTRGQPSLQAVFSSGEDYFSVEEDFDTPLEEGFYTPGDTPVVVLSDLTEGTSGEHDYYKNFEVNVTKLEQAPKRRDLNNWKESDVLSEVNNNPRDEPDFYEDSSYLSESYVSDVDGKHPQYYQKNYYYNYYPLVNGRRYYVPRVPELYASKKGNKAVEVKWPFKLKKMKPCREYLEFLRSAFESLDRNMDYQDDYNDYSDDWRDSYRYPNVFGARLYGPTLYVDNSGKAFQLNNRLEGIPIDERVIHVTQDSIILSGGITQNPTGQETDETGSETTTSINANWNDTGFYRTGIDMSPSSSEMSKVKSTTVDNREEIDGYQKWWKTLRTDSHQTQTITYDLDNSSGETNKDFDDYDFSLRPSYPTTTISSPMFSTDDYYGTLGGEKPEPTFYGVHSSPFYWKSVKEEKTTVPTPIFPISPTVNSFTSKTVLSIQNSEEGERKESDCNDHMLPCPDTINITYPLNGYCNRYVSCESGRAIRRTCPDGLHFNVVIKGCDVPHNSFCTYSCPESNGFFGIPGDCSGYFVCKESMPEYRMCPPRMHWDPSRRICTFAELSRCPMKCVKANEVKHYEGDCKAYIVCLNGLPFYHKCPPNSKFDSRSLSCVPDRMSKCVDDPRLLTKTLNPSLLCRDVDVKIGPNTWCSYFIG